MDVESGTSRRDFISRLPLLFGARAALGQQHVQRRPDFRFPIEPRKRLAVTSWPFRAYIESPLNRYRDPKRPGWDLKAFPRLIADKFNVHNINPLSDHFPSTDPAYLEQFRTAVDSAQSHVVDLGLAGQSVYDPDGAQRKASIQYGRKWIDIAVVVGSPSVRQHIKGVRGVKPDVGLAAATLGEIAAYGSKRNVIVNLENDNAVSEDPFFLLAVIQKVNSPYLRALPDFGNSLQTHDAEYNAKALTAMFRYAYGMAHVKDQVRCGENKLCTVNLKRMFAIARASSYRGYFSMEVDTHGDEDPFQGTSRLIEGTLDYLT